MAKESEFIGKFEKFKDSQKFKEDKRLVKKGYEKTKNFDISGTYESNLELGGVARKYLDYARKGHEQGLSSAIKVYELLEKVDNASKSRVLSAFKELYKAKEGKVSNKVEEQLKEFLSAPSTKKRNLEKKVSSVIAMGGIAGALIFLSPALTGNIVGNVGNSTSSWIGGCLFILGLGGALFYFRKK